MSFTTIGGLRNFRTGRGGGIKKTQGQKKPSVKKNVPIWRKKHPGSRKKAPTWRESPPYKKNSEKSHI